jgi:hypothetical protein
VCYVLKFHHTPDSQHSTLLVSLSAFKSVASLRLSGYLPSAASASDFALSASLSGPHHRSVRNMYYYVVKYSDMTSSQVRVLRLGRLKTLFSGCGDSGDYTAAGDGHGLQRASKSCALSGVEQRREGS